MDDALANSADRTSTRFFLSIKDRRAFKTASCRSLRSVAESFIGSEACGLALEIGSAGCGLPLEAGALNPQARGFLSRGAVRPPPLRCFIPPNMPPHPP